MQVDDAAPADLHGGDGVALDPAAHHVLGDLSETQHFSQDELRAERCIAEGGDTHGIPFIGKPHYSRLFHSSCPILLKIFYQIVRFKLFEITIGREFALFKLFDLFICNK